MPNYRRNPLVALAVLFSLGVLLGCQPSVQGNGDNSAVNAKDADTEKDKAKDAAEPTANAAVKKEEGPPNEAPSSASKQATEAEAIHPYASTKGLIRLDDKQDVWIDKANKRIVIDGEICLREGWLELFACEEGMKTHESVVKFKGKPSTVHAALLAIGADQGKPVSFEPEYKPATGSEIDIRIAYVDENRKLQEVSAQQLVRNQKTGKALDQPWVFGGSYFWTDPMTGEQIYMGDSTGDFICLSNFPTATMDLPIASSQSNDALLYEAFTQNIPPVGTKVRMTLKPKPMKKPAVTDADADGPDGEATQPAKDPPAKEEAEEADSE